MTPVLIVIDWFLVAVIIFTINLETEAYFLTFLEVRSSNQGVGNAVISVQSIGEIYKIQPLPFLMFSSCWTPWKSLAHGYITGISTSVFPLPSPLWTA